MKSISNVFFTAALCSLTGVAFSQNGAYKLNGKITPQPVTAKAYLYYQNDAGQHTDSVLIKSGTFTFSGTVAQPTSCYLLINPKGNGFRQPGVAMTSLYLEPGTINLNATTGSLETRKVSGGPINADNERLNAQLAPVKQKMAAISKEYQEAPAAKKESAEFQKSLEDRYSSLSDEQKKMQIAFIKANPASPFSVMVLEDVGGAVPSLEEVEPLYNGLASAIKASAAGRKYAQEIEKLRHTAVGAMAPEFSMADTTGKQVALSSFRGKYVLIDFWASWCGPCRAENPNVVKAYNAYKSKGFTVLGVSLDQPNAKDRWMKAIHDDGLFWTQVSDLKGWKNEAAALYSVRAIPQNFLLDPNGKIIATNIRGEDLSLTLKKFLGASE